MYHCELSWILENNININRLLRMHQFKDKIAKSGSKTEAFSNPLGLLSYPVLMTADIMMYNATRSPPLSLFIRCACRRRSDPARRSGPRHHRPFQPQIQRAIQPPGAGGVCGWGVRVSADVGRRIMSLSDGTKKMSKSSRSQFSNISIIGAHLQLLLCRLSGADLRVHQEGEDGFSPRTIVAVDGSFAVDLTEKSGLRCTICFPSWLPPRTAVWKPPTLSSRWGMGADFM